MKDFENEGQIWKLKFSKIPGTNWRENIQKYDMCYKIIERDLHGNKWMQNSTNEEVQQSLSLMIQEDSTYQLPLVHFHVFLVMLALHHIMLWNPPVHPVFHFDSLIEEIILFWFFVLASPTSLLESPWVTCWLFCEFFVSSLSKRQFCVLL